MYFIDGSTFGLIFSIFNVIKSILYSLQITNLPQRALQSHSGLYSWTLDSDKKKPEEEQHAVQNTPM